MGLFGISLNDLGAGAKKTAGSIYDYATPGSGSSRLTDSGSAYFAPPTPTYSVSNIPRAAASAAGISSAQAQGNALTAQTNALLAAIRNAQPKQVYAPALDLGAINAQARSAAESNVNPYYTKQLNDFLAEQAAKRQQSETEAATNIQQLETDLKNKLEGNDITKARTEQDTTTNLDQLATQANQAQLDSGSAFAGDRLQQARDLAKAGLTGGLGAQQTEAATLAHNTTEDRATAATDQAKEQQVLTKARTFEDLARSGTLATAAKETGVKQVNVSLSDFITNQGFETESKKSSLEAARLQAVGQEQQNQGRLLVNNFIGSIADPAQRQAALQAYGGAF